MSASAILTLGLGQAASFTLTIGLTPSTAPGTLAAVLEGQSLESVSLVGQSLEPIILLGRD